MIAREVNKEYNRKANVRLGNKFETTNYTSTAMNDYNVEAIYGNKGRNKS